jgi:histidinol phosphatase-like enzyme (inositol monophosphatase family)
MVAVDTSLLDEAVALVRAAGEVTLEWFRNDALAIEHKGDGTPVTQADKAAERLLREELGQRFPDDAVIGEEEPTAAGRSGRTWVVDPIDGTKSFTHGVPLYSNLLALYDEEGCAIGAINLPALGETVYAARGLGCFVNGRPTRVSTHGSLGGGCVCTSGLGPWTPAQLAAMRAARPLFRTWGDGYGFALVATGRIEAMVDPRVAVWDLGPMPVIMGEAGGRYTDIGGDDTVTLDVDHVSSSVASNGLVHDELLAVLASAPATTDDQSSSSPSA